MFLSKQKSCRWQEQSLSNICSIFLFVESRTLYLQGYMQTSSEVTVTQEMFHFLMYGDNKLQWTNWKIPSIFCSVVIIMVEDSRYSPEDKQEISEKQWCDNFLTLIGLTKYAWHPAWSLKQNETASNAIS